MASLKMERSYKMFSVSEIWTIVKIRNSFSAALAA
jgi:hypothetical protein